MSIVIDLLVNLGSWRSEEELPDFILGVHLVSFNRPGGIRKSSARYFGKKRARTKQMPDLHNNCGIKAKRRMTDASPSARLVLYF